MQKILIATGLYPPDIGGPATYTKMLEKHLPAHGVEYVVAPYGWVRRYPKLFRHLAYAWKLVRESRECDVIYALDPVSVGLPAYIAHVITKKPLMMRIPGDYAWEQGQQRFGVTDTLDDFVKNNSKSYSIPVRVLRWIERKTTCAAIQVIVPSEYMRGVVRSWGVPIERIVRIYSALHPINVAETREDLRRQFKYNGMVVTTAARLVPWKGIHILIDAVALLREGGEDVHLIVMGDGVLMEELTFRAREKGIAQYVRFVGRQTKDALGAAIKASDVFALNTSYEGLSHQLLEVMDLGVPIVTTPVGGNVELIEDGVSGILVPVNDVKELASAILRVGTHEQLRQNLIQHARSQVRHFSEEDVVNEFVDVYRNVLQRIDTQQCVHRVIISE